MHFCAICHNMYYLKINEENGGNTINYYCRNCGHEDTTLTAEAICVSETQLRRGEQKFTHMVNEYTKYDPTLPRINTIKCPNQECSSNGGSEGMEGGAGQSTAKKTAKKSTAKKIEGEEAAQGASQAQVLSEKEQAQVLSEKEQAQGTKATDREVIYIRYDDINMKYVYLCVHCDTTWKTDNRN